MSCGKQVLLDFFFLGPFILRQDEITDVGFFFVLSTGTSATHRTI